MSCRHLKFEWSRGEGDVCARCGLHSVAAIDEVHADKLAAEAHAHGFRARLMAAEATIAELRAALKLVRQYITDGDVIEDIDALLERTKP